MTIVQFHKACDCDAPSVHGGMRIVCPENTEAIYSFTAMPSGGPACVSCGLPWAKLETPPDATFIRCRREKCKADIGIPFQAQGVVRCACGAWYGYARHPEHGLFAGPVERPT